MSRNLVRRLVAFAVPILVVGFSAPSLWAQFSSSIDGRVVDATQAIVPGIDLTLENLITGAMVTTKTSENGYFRFPSMPAAVFKLTASAPGFKTTTVSGLQVEVGQARTVNVALEVGTGSTAITVEAQAAAVDLSDAKVSGVIESRQLTDLPIPGRNFLALLALTPGVTGDPGRADVFGSDRHERCGTAR